MPLEFEIVVLGRLLLSGILAGVIGTERELARKPAGFRTHMLLAIAATLLVSVAAAFIEEADAQTTAEQLRPDPLRIIEAIVAGVAFLGAGTIIRHRDGHGVEGLTTAGSLLLVAALGVTVALGLYLLAILTTVLALAILRTLNHFEHDLRSRLESKGRNPDSSA